jgi:hypothetical protein
MEAKIDINNEYYFETEDGEIFRDPDKALFHTLVIESSKYYSKIREDVDKVLVDFMLSKSVEEKK